MGRDTDSIGVESSRLKFSELDLFPQNNQAPSQLFTSQTIIWNQAILVWFS
jgi:hypothetical protein